MRPSRERARKSIFAGALLVLAVALLLVNIPTQGRSSSGSSFVLQTGAGTSYIVTWNGNDVSSYSTVSAARSIDFTQSVTLEYNWSGTAPVTISDARLQMYYFGFAMSTRDQIVTNPVAKASGSIPLTWTPISINYVLEGAYRLTASFLAPNGTTMFSENFYVRGNAPLGFVALVPIVLLLIAIYEVYGILRSGRYAAIGRKPSAPPPAAPPASPATEPTAPTEAAEGGSTPPSEPSPPASGGSS